MISNRYTVSNSFLEYLAMKSCTVGKVYYGTTMFKIKYKYNKHRSETLYKIKLTGITHFSNNLRITFAVSSVKVTLEVSGSFWMAVTSWGV